jgi:hypothetical protein
MEQKVSSHDLHGDANAEHETRERLGVCLMRLAAMKPHNLAHPAHSSLSFRSGLPYFERTLDLFRKVAETDLQEVPSEYLKIVADDAQETLERLNHIQNFTGEGVEHPEQVRAAMITELRDAYPPMYEDLSVIIKKPAAELARVKQRRSGAMLIVGLAIAMLVAAIVGYQYLLYTLFTGKILSAMH